MRDSVSAPMIIARFTSPARIMESAWITPCSQPGQPKTRSNATVRGFSIFSRDFTRAASAGTMSERVVPARTSPKLCATMM